MTTYSTMLRLRKPILGQTDWKDEEDEGKAILDFVVAAMLRNNQVVTDLAVSDGGGLTANYAAGVVEVAGSRFTITASSVAVSPAGAPGEIKLNWIYVDDAGVVHAATVQPSGDYVPLAVVDTTETAISGMADLRGMAEPEAVHDNLLINPEFLVNQREYPADGVATLADGEYGHDMMRNMTGSTQKYSIDGSGNIDLDGIVLGHKNDNILAKDGEVVIFSVESGEVQIYGLGLASWTTVDPDTPCTWTLDASGNSGWIQFKKSGTNTFRRPKLEVGYVPTRFGRRDIGIEQIQCFVYYWVRTVYFGTSQNKGYDYEPILLPIAMRTVPTGTVLEFTNVDSSAATSATLEVADADEIKGFHFDNWPGAGTFRFVIRFSVDANYYT